MLLLLPVSVKLIIQLPRSKKIVSSSIDPETHYCAYFGVNCLIAAAVTAGSLQNGLLQDLYFERKMAEFSEPWEINNANETK